MNRPIANGVYPTMITPFTEQNEIDFNAVDHLVKWYAKHGCNGIFAVCQSSELFHLSLDERVALGTRVVKTAAEVNPEMCIVASGHISDSIEAQAYELTAMKETGADALVWISNRLDLHNEGDDVWIANAERLLSKIPSDILLGIYECPRPYKRLLTPRILDWCLSTGRFRFIKDTCCDPDLLLQRLAQLNGTEIKLFNANAQTLLLTLRKGAAGYSSIMANFHPYLYAWLCDHYDEIGKADELEEILSMAAFTECMAYPVTAKYHLQLEGIPMTLKTRTRSEHDLDSCQKLVVGQMKSLCERLQKTL